MRRRLLVTSGRDIRRVCGFTLVALAILAPVAWSQSSAADVFNAHVAAFNANDASKYAGFLADNVLVMSPDQPPGKGRAAIQKAFEALFKAGRATYKGEILDSGMSGDLAYVVYSGTQDDAKAVKQPVQGVAVYKRINGQWQAVIDATMAAQK